MTLEELNRSWTFDDIVDANDMADFYGDAKAEAAKPKETPKPRR